MNPVPSAYSRIACKVWARAAAVAKTQGGEPTLTSLATVALEKVHVVPLLCCHGASAKCESSKSVWLLIQVVNVTSAQRTLESAASLAEASGGEQAHAVDTPCSSPAECKLKSAVANRLCASAPPLAGSDTHFVPTFVADLPYAGATTEGKHCRHPTSLATPWFASKDAPSHSHLLN